MAMALANQRSGISHRAPLPSSVPRCAAVLTQRHRQCTATCLACGGAHFVALSLSLCLCVADTVEGGPSWSPGGAPNLPSTMLPACLPARLPTSISLTSPGPHRPGGLMVLPVVACCMTQVQVGRMTFSALTHKIKSNGGVYKNSSNTSQTRTVKGVAAVRRQGGAEQTSYMRHFY